MTRTVHIVPHTHWDREWYRPFQTFRMQLVDLLDGLLPAMAADPAYAHFMLDGQMAVVDDYLEIRPEAEPVLRRLAAAGRITMGPWYILMDEFLVSGETMIRDLQLGLDRAARFGGAMQVGYLPDMFGHVAQMPQLLAQFGFDQTVVWRGVPEAIDAPAFWWEAPDGSRVRAAYLATGYSNGSVLPGDAKELIAQIDGWCHEQGDRAGDPVLWMNGTDHLLPQAHLGRVVAEANDLQDDYRLEVTSLARAPRGRVPERRRRCPSGRASCARVPGPTCSWAWRPTGSTCTRPRCAPPGRSSRSPSRSRRSTSRPTAGRPASSTRPGSRSSATAPTTRSAPARSTRWAGPSSTASTRPAPSPRA